MEFEQAEAYAAQMELEYQTAHETSLHLATMATTAAAEADTILFEAEAATTEVIQKEEEAKIAKTAAAAKDQEVFDLMTDDQKEEAANAAFY